jgi:DNA polymerase-4
MNTQDRVDADSSTIRWLFLDMNSFFASCEQQVQPALRGRPVAVVPVMAATSCVIAASYEAKARGVRTGTLVRDARLLCPGITFVLARPKLYVDFHHRFCAAIERHIPIDQILSIDEVACSLDRRERDPTVAFALARRLKAELREQVGVCLTCSIGIAGNRLLAKLASDMQKPDGLVLLHPADLPRAILHLPPSAIAGIGARMEARLAAYGLNDMAALWEASPALLRRVWGGVVGARFYALLHGGDLPSVATTSRSLGHQHVLPPENRSLQGAYPIARQLLTRAAVRLRRDGFFAQRLALDVKTLVPAGHLGDEARFAETQETGFLLGVLHDLWARLPACTPFRVGVTLAGLTPAADHQPDLFERPRDRALGLLLDRINARFGRDTIAYGFPQGPRTAKIAFSRVPGLDEV